MEVMTFAGLPTVLFLEMPTAERRARFAGYRGIGIAGVARSQSPAWMEANLPPVFRTLAELKAPIAHYKVCSTFDSAPQVGSIGRAIDLAAPILGGTWHPLVVAAPAIARYQAFGNLFAAVNGVGYRLDRHPTMSRHPVTPMERGGRPPPPREANRQDHRPRRSSCHEARRGGREAGARAGAGRRDRGPRRGRRRDAGGGRPPGLGAPRRAALRRRLARCRVRACRPLACRRAPRAAEGCFRAPPAERIACVSGSCSPVTAGQIAFAEQNGFATIRLDAARAVDEAAWERELGRAADRALAAIGEGKDPLVFTAAGPDDPAVARMAAAIEACGLTAGMVNDRVGAGLGRLLDRVLREAGLARAAIAGGDTSGHATLRLGVYALTAMAPIAPGAPYAGPTPTTRRMPGSRSRSRAARSVPLTSSAPSSAAVPQSTEPRTRMENWR